MLTSETRKHIDSARQVLVGKVPDPKSQVNEITNALIYKFMDDMDEMTASVGGKRRYFVGDYEKYSWRKIMDPKVGAHERISLYTEALARLSKNENLPELFRNIFSRAYLPFNDGRTLSLFLQEIDYFDYKNSESLGDAYEYLLSIMGSQGDAGQFRTPRHIIDFIVDVVDPDKNDSVLDPACGTAGFLISAYKHVMAKYDGKDDISGTPTKSEKKLSADERKKLHDNYFGFDIDDNMVKMAQVNMYLHGFLDPDITVHDTLSSEDYWHDKYDVILANPPFMSPKGGVMPHNKFGVESTRAEVLFVDYITTHLKPHGRAGIVVPEGIIFQSGTAYKQLRKNLVEDGLYAVVSLPSGVFAPYSGVKTSILLFNNELVKTSTEILFVKITHDGTDLGAKKRVTVANDLVPATESIKQFENGQFKESKIAHAVSKQIIIDSGDYNLSGDRYKISAEVQSEFDLIELGELIDEQSQRIKEIKNIEVWSVSNKDGFVLSSEYFDKQVASADISNYKIIKPGYFAYNPSRINVGSLAFNNSAKTGAVSPMYVVFSIKESAGLSADYLFSLLKSDKLNEFILRLAQGAVRQQLRVNDLKIIKIPLPPLEIQEQIVAELDGYAGIIAGAKQITQNWKPKIDIDPEWEKVKLGEVCEFTQGVQIPKEEQINESRPGYKRYLYIQDFKGESKSIYVEDKYKSKELTTKDLVMANTGTPGKAFLAVPGILSNNLFRISFDDDVLDQKYLFYNLDGEYFQEILQSQMKGGIQKHLGHVTISSQEIPLPPLAIQKQIVEKIVAERALVDSAKKLIAIYEEKTKNVIAKLWDQQ